MAGYSGTPLAKKLGLKPGTKLLAINAPKDYRVAEFERDLPKARAAMSIDGAVWVSWYKKSAKIPTDVTEDIIRNRALKTDLVDVKVCAVSDVWSGLKLVVRKHLR